MNAEQFSSALGKVNDKYIMEAVTYERKKKSGWLKWGAMAACFSLIATVAMAALPGLLKETGGVLPPLNFNPEPAISDTVDAPQKTINVVDLSQDNPGEFAGDMYRPKGFNDNIGSALALKMSITDDISYKYSVLVRTPLESTLEQVLNNANKSLNVTINATDAISVNISGRLYIVSTEEEPPAGRRPLVVLLSRFPLFQFHFLPHIPRILFPDCIRHIGVKGRIPGPLDRFPHTGFHAFRQGQFHSVIRLITVFLLCGCSRRPPGRRVFLFISHKKAPLSTVPHYSTLRTFTVV